MKNYLLYPDCHSEESINRCRFALLKLLGLYNLRPPATVSVVIHTTKAAAFENFLPFFKEMQFSEKGQQKWNDWPHLQKLLSAYTGNVLVCHTNGYLKGPAEELFAKIADGNLLYCLQPGTEGNDQANDAFFEKVFAAGVNSNSLQNPSTMLYTSAQRGEAFFALYKPRKNVNMLLKTLFMRNEEESMANMVKKARNIDLEAIEQEATATDRLPFYKKWLLQLQGKNTLLRRQLNKL